MIRKLTDPLWDEMDDEVESDIDVTKDTFEDTYAYDTVSGAVQPHQPRSLPQPLNTDRYSLIGGPFAAAGVNPFFRGHWRNGRQVVEWSQAELREADASIARSSTETPATTSQMPTASTTSSTTSTSTTTEVQTTTPSVNNLIEQLVQALANQIPTPESTASSPPATTTPTPTTTPSANNLIEHIVQALLNQIPTPESTVSSIQQLIQLLQPQVNPTTEEATTAQSASTTDKPDDLTDVIIEAIASLGLDIQNVRITRFKIQNVRIQNVRITRFQTLL